MRRFEFSDGKSNKFWEVSVDGADITTRWGRIGTNGQTKTKTLASEDRASAEMDKQIRSKTKKGYAEVDVEGDDDPAPAPPPPQPVPEPQPVEEPVAVLSDVLPEPTVEPRHAKYGVWAAPEGGDWRKTWGRFGKEWKKDNAFRRGGGLGTLQAEQVAADTWLLGPVPSEAPEPDVAAAALRMAGRGWLVSAFVELRGVAWTADVVLRALSFGRDNQYINNHWVHGLTRAAIQPLHNDAGGMNFVREFRHLLLAADPAEQDAARKVAIAARSGTIYDRMATAVLFGDRDWIRKDAADAEPADAVCLLGGVDDAVAAEALAKAICKAAGAWSSWPVLRQSDAVVDTLGLAAIPVLRPLLGKASEGADAPFKALCRIQSVEAARQVAHYVDHRYWKKEAVAWLRERPALAIVALSGAPDILGTASGLLSFLVGAHPDVARAVLPAVSDKTRIEALLARTSVADVAPTSKLPAVLTNPPWLQKRKAKKAVVLERTMLDRPRAVVWRREDAAHRVVPKNYLHANYSTVDKAMAALSRNNYGSLWDLRYMSDSVALQVWNTGDPKALWSWGDMDVALGVLARFGIDGLPGFVGYFEKNPTIAAKVLSRIDAPECAVPLARGHARLKSVRKVATTWFHAHPETAAVGLIPVAIGPTGKERDAAAGALRLVDRETVLRVAAEYDAVEVVQDIVDTDPLVAALPKRMPKLPKWFDPAAMRRPTVDGKPISPTAAGHLASILQISPLDDPYVGLEHVEEVCDPDSLTAFAIDLFQAWLANGGVGKEDFAMMALGHFGTDDIARELTPLIRRWPGEGANARATKALDILEAVGTDIALMHLHGISQKLKFKSLKEKAGIKIASIADKRGLSPEELADRLVPDLDLDDDGSLVLDYGPRQFVVGFDEKLVPYVKGPDGKKRSALPKAGKSDDAELAKASRKRWSALKKDARTLATAQIQRLETAMCARRRWDRPTFETFLLGHPLVKHLVQRLVWGVYDNDVVVATFRVSEDGSLADVDDEEWSLPDEATIGICHRLELGEDVRVAWGQLLADYEILQCFEQLGREVYACETPTATSIDHVKGVTVPWGTVLGLGKHGWQRGVPQDGGCVWEMVKPLGDLEASLDLDPGLFTPVSESEDQTLGDVVVRKKGEWGRDKDLVKQGDLDPILFSELVRDLRSVS